MDLSALTDAISLGTVVAGIIAVGALKMAPKLARYAVTAIGRMFPG